jgi:hypothetical protein
MLLKRLPGKYLVFLEYATILAFCLLPLFLTYPYRVNIFLSWEGAYRLYLGQVPYRDFGMPTGYAYWLLPALFFKIFGPYMMSLVKAQFVLNIAAGFSFRSIIKNLQVKPGWSFIVIFFFCLSYLLMNFWPWYNQTVFVFQLISIACLVKSYTTPKNLLSIVWISVAGLFSVLSFLTKQDGGGLAIMLNLALVIYLSIASKSVKFISLYIVSLAVFAAILIVPFLPYNFSYWFNYGQPPHNSRLKISDITTLFFQESQWLKFYMVACTVLFIVRIKKFKNLLSQPMDVLFYLLTIGILVQAAIIQVTSYTPPDNNIYYHSFAIAYLIFALLQDKLPANVPVMAIAFAGIMLWWSGSYYKYIVRVTNRLFPPKTVAVNENEVSVFTYHQSYDTSRVGVKLSTWKFVPDSKAFAGVYMPSETVDGVQRLRQMEVVQSGDAKILNMTELTPLAYELGYELERGTPLWYHLGVSMFSREVDFFNNRLRNGYYDVVLFETIPMLNNFYPEPIYEVLKEEYLLVDKFLAPRPQNNAFVEVYIRK